MPLEAAHPSPYAEPTLTFRNPPAVVIDEEVDRQTPANRLGPTLVNEDRAADHAPANDPASGPTNGDPLAAGRNDYALGGAVDRPQLASPS